MVVLFYLAAMISLVAFAGLIAFFVYVGTVVDDE